jgi:DNA-binding GntR family transcriptional regulator
MAQAGMQTLRMNAESAAVAENKAVSPARTRPATTISSPRPAGAGPIHRTLYRETLADQVAETLRGMILTGEIAPETPVTQSEIARMLGVSTMPAREALLRLGSEGFLIASPNRSFTVRRITEQDIGDIYWMHAVLAGELTRRACLRGGESLVKELRECEAEFAQAWNHNNAQAMDTANWRFHRMINKAAGAPKLWMVLNATLRFIPTRFYVLVPAWTEESKRGHAEILQAFERHDAAAARLAAETHVRAAGELLISSFWRRHAWVTPENPDQTRATVRK